MKKLSAVLMCAMIVFCASCGNKGAEGGEEEKHKQEEQAPQRIEQNLVEEVIGDYLSDKEI